MFGNHPPSSRLTQPKAASPVRPFGQPSVASQGSLDTTCRQSKHVAFSMKTKGKHYLQSNHNSLKDACCNHLNHAACSTPKYSWRPFTSCNLRSVYASGSLQDPSTRGFQSTEPQKEADTVDGCEDPFRHETKPWLKPLFAGSCWGIESFQGFLGAKRILWWKLPLLEVPKRKGGMEETPYLSNTNKYRTIGPNTESLQPNIQGRR